MNRTKMKDCLRAAYNIAKNSPDPSTKVGAVILHPTGGMYGWNHIPPGVKIDLTDRVLKYKVIAHAERHAIFNAAKNGIALKDTTLICPWACCADCAIAIVLSGIRRVVCHGEAMDKTPDRWVEDIKLAAEIFSGSGVDYVKFYGRIGECENLFDGEIWKP